MLMYITFFCLKKEQKITVKTFDHSIVVLSKNGEKKYIKKNVIFLCFLYCLSKNKLSSALDIFSRYCIGCREGLMRVCLDVTGY